MGFIWESEAARAHGLDLERLQELQEDLARRNTRALLIARRDRIVWEWYAPGHGPAKLHFSASLAKSLVGGVSLALALDDGRVAVDEPACKWIPAWRRDPLRSRITLRHLASHSSGLEDAEEEGKDHRELTGWKGTFWQRSPDPFSIALREAPVLFEPGTAFAYSNPGMAALAYAVTASLKGAPHPDLRSLLHKRVMEPIGIAADEWSVGYGTTYHVDGLPLAANWGGGDFTARAVARVGRLVLRLGNWDGRQLIGEQAVRQVLTSSGNPLPARTEGNPWPAPALGWYTNADGIWPTVPRDAFAGAGASHQILVVVPSLDLIVVRNGGRLEPPTGQEGFWGSVLHCVIEPVIQALRA